jgi:hypothetical protein
MNTEETSGREGPHRNAGAPLISSQLCSSEQHHKRHKAQNATRSAAMSINGADVSEYVTTILDLLAPVPTQSKT